MIILHFDLQPQFKYMIYFIYTSHHFEVCQHEFANLSSPSASIPLRHITVTLLPRQHVSFRLALVSDAAVIWVITLRDERFLGHAAIRSFGSDQLVVKL